MAKVSLAAQRLASQRLVGPPLPSPEAVVDWLGAVQAQDVAGAAWGVALRAPGADLGAALDAGTVLRVHVLRPTWHLVRPADLRWMQALTAPRVRAQLATYDRRLGIDQDLVSHSHRLLASALADGRHRTRAELGDALAAGGIEVRGQALAHLMMHAELDAVVCSGRRQGPRQTYALAEERVQAGPVLDHDEAVARLARLYLRGHGPATPHDFAWWSGLTVHDARRGYAALGAEVEWTAWDGVAYGRLGPARPAGLPAPCVHLLPNYDEHVVAYRNHGPSLDPGAPHALAGWGNGSTPHQIVRDGLVVGGWRRRIHSDRVEVQATLHVRLSPDELSALAAEAERYGRFLGQPVELTVASASARTPVRDGRP